MGLWRAFASLSCTWPPLNRSSSNDPDADPRLRLRPAVGAFALSRGQGQSGVPLVLRLKHRRQDPDHSVFSRARNDRFRDSDIFRQVFERVVEACISAGLVGGKEFAVDASLIAADANKQRSIPGSEWIKERDPETASRAVKEYMATLDDAAFGAATKVTPKFVSPSDPAAQWTGAMRGPAFFAYSDNYLIDVKVGIIMDVEASRSIRQAEVGASRTMIERTQERFDIKPERLAGDTAYGSGANLNWLVNDKDIAPHIPVIDKSKREDGTFSREDLTFDKDRNVYICPANKILTTTGKLVNDGETLLYRTKARDCRCCPLKAQLSKGVHPQNPAQHLRGSARRCPGAGQDRGVQAIRPRQETCRDVVCALEAYPAARPAAIARAMRCSVRVHVGSDRTQRPQACQVGRPPHRSPLCALRKRCKRQ